MTFILYAFHNPIQSTFSIKFEVKGAIHIMPAPYQQAQNQQQPVMAKPPAVITTKDLSYLKDAMSWLLLATKKYAHFANECQDQEVKQLLNQVGQTHQRHYNTLLAHCQTQNSTATAARAAVNPQQQQWTQQQQ
jgi:hypothetical protein